MEEAGRSAIFGNLREFVEKSTCPRGHCGQENYLTNVGIKTKTMAQRSIWGFLSRSNKSKQDVTAPSTPREGGCEPSEGSQGVAASSTPEETREPTEDMQNVAATSTPEKTCEPSEGGQDVATPSSEPQPGPSSDSQAAEFSDDSSVYVESSGDVCLIFFGGCKYFLVCASDFSFICTSAT